MAANSTRDYDDVTLPGASAATQMLRAPVGLDSADYADLPLEVFIDVEDTGVGHVTRP